MSDLTPQQQRMREQFEGLIGAAAPILDLVLGVGDRISRIVEPEDHEYYPVRSGTEASMLRGSAPSRRSRRRPPRSRAATGTQARRAPLAMTPTEIVKRERDRAVPVAIGTFVGILLFFIAGNFGAITATLLNPDAVDSEPSSTSSRTATTCSSGTILQSAGLLLMAAPLFYLFQAAQARSDTMRSGLIGVTIAGPLFLGVSGVIAFLALDAAASDFATAGGGLGQPRGRVRRRPARRPDDLRDRPGPRLRRDVRARSSRWSTCPCTRCASGCSRASGNARDGARRLDPLPRDPWDPHLLRGDGPPDRKPLAPRPAAGLGARRGRAVAAAGAGAGRRGCR